jgi:hypothetical protein
MSRHIEIENRSGPRYLASIEVHAEWDASDGAHVVADGVTENVGPEGTLIHLPRQLPEVGSTVRLELQSEDGTKLQVIGEVLRIERNPGHPLAALSLVGETDEWKGLIWEPAAPKVAPPPPSEEEEGEEDEDADGEQELPTEIH